MYSCARGHQSQAADYCDECGAPIAGPPGAPAAAPAQPPGARPAPATPSACPQCGTVAVGRFCEVCGCDILMSVLAPDLTAATSPTAAAGTTGPAGSNAGGEPGSGAAGDPPPQAAVPEAAGGAPGPAAWQVVASADAAYHARMQEQSEPGVEPVDFPAFCPPRRFTLAGAQLLVGRRSRSRGIEPEVDLSGPPGDPAISHAHALLVALPDGGWAVVDLDSANGTYLNDAADPIEPNVPVALAAGDRVHLGAWTTLTLQRQA